MDPIAPPGILCIGGIGKPGGKPCGILIFCGIGIPGGCGTGNGLIPAYGGIPPPWEIPGGWCGSIPNGVRTNPPVIDDGGNCGIPCGADCGTAAVDVDGILGCPGGAPAGGAPTPGAAADGTGRAEVVTVMIAGVPPVVEITVVMNMSKSCSQ